jgi:hypothetical protein
MYSSIEEEARCEVINRCYWPLFKLADVGFPIGIEVPAVTLEIIKKLDPNWIEAFSTFIAEDKIEFIGSGYSQIIGPLVPAKVNEWNQKLGLEYYQKLLGVTPKVALANEMAYSSGIVEHYINVGYKGLIMEWNNPRAAHQEWKNEWRYFPQKAIGNNGQTIPLIWSDSIAFQKFQRYAHGEVQLEKYIEYIKSHIGDNDRYFPLYSNDVEIFDYRPGRYNTEAQIDGSSEWGRITDLYGYLIQQDWNKLIFPSDILDEDISLNGNQKLHLESSTNPIPVKKQEKYNINRWALSGRGDVEINTKCYQIYNSFFQEENDNSDDWKELCYLWSSDFRTHITEKRWKDYKVRLDAFLLNLDFNNSNTEEKSFEKVDVIEVENRVVINSSYYTIILNKNKGLSIQELIINKFGEKYLLGTLEHGYYDDISLGADYFSGHAVIEKPGEHKITDLGIVNQEIIKSNKEVNLQTMQKWGDYTFRNKIVFEDDKIIFYKSIETLNHNKAVIRPFSFTFNPEVWDKDSLYVKTNNGGSSFEKFYLSGQNISHGDIYSSLISARHGFGNTEGKLVVGDKNQSINFESDMFASALKPSIIYKEMASTYLFRLQYSAGEIDETTKKKDINLSARLIIFCNSTVGGEK